ncbi:FeoA domain protein [Clostridiales bacterium 1_7_47FAA]|nr:FeoA domain protein [Clostridiales bacterium 1_7_47FAA]
MIRMPLTMAREGEVTSIKRVGGKEEVRRHLENMGFVPGTDVTVVTVNNGNVIVNVKEARVAISREMANKIMI